MNKKLGILASAALAVALIISIVPVTHAQTNPPTNQSGWGRGREGIGMGMMKPGISGTVTAISGATLTVTGHEFGPGIAMNSATTTYTVDASSATVRKGNATSTLSAVSVNDSVFVQGTVNSSNVVATMILDGVMRGRMGGPGMGMHMGSTTGAFSGNGEPVVAGSVTSVSGSSITITTKSNTTYTIDASSAKFVTSPGNASGTIANVKTGDQIVVQGTVNGSAVTASSIIDMAKSGNGKGPGTGPGRGMGGIFGAIGAFFSHMFGF